MQWKRTDKCTYGAFGKFVGLDSEGVPVARTLGSDRNVSVGWLRWAVGLTSSVFDTFSFLFFS